VEIELTNDQLTSLEASFKDFYKLGSSPKIQRKLVLEKEEYKRFLKSRTKARTRFETTPSVIDLSFDTFRTPFEFIATRTEFTLPGGKAYEVYEELHAPNGYTKTVKVTSGEDTPQIFPTYFQSEQYILANFLKEIHGDSN
jgi:hypothetical protein